MLGSGKRLTKISDSFKGKTAHNDQNGEAN
jgi:hypothetical protein